MGRPRISEVSTISATEDTTDRCAGETLLAGLANIVEASAGELDRRRSSWAPGETIGPEAGGAWGSAARALHDLSLHSVIGLTEAEADLLDAVFEPLAPAWLIVEGLIALIVDQVAIDAQPDQVVAIDHSLSGLRSLVSCLRRQLPAGK
jgi:hypothetical protein